MKNKFSIDYSFELKETTEDEEYFYFTGYGSTKDLDLVNDIVEPTAFNESLKNRMPKLLWQHNRDEPIGVYSEAAPDDKGLMLRGKMPLADDFVRGRVVPQMKIGSVDALSIGFIVQKSEWDSDKGIRTIVEAELLEVSLVTFPANPEARVTGLKERELSRWASVSEKAIDSRAQLPGKFAEAAYKWDAGRAVKNCKEIPDVKTSIVEGALHIVDSIKGVPVIVPRAVFVARAQLDGARGGVDLDETDRKQAEKLVNALYIEMDLDPPFSYNKTTPYTITELKGLPAGYLGDVLRYKTLSKEAANFASKAVMRAAHGMTADDEKALSGLIDKMKKFNQEQEK